MNLLTHMNWAGDSKIYPEVMDELGIPETSSWDKGAFEGKLEERPLNKGLHGMRCTDP